MSAIATIQEFLGGEGVTGPLRTERDLRQLVRRGVPTEAVDHFLQAAHMNFSAIETHVLNRRTFKRRQKDAQVLEPAESDRLLRLVGVVANAIETFGSADKALLWLNRETRALDGETPLALTDTDRGAREVEALLGRIGHGLAA
jgi:putative toxin-antitoxin system antitoxin component (TIGR02293 family)